MSDQRVQRMFAGFEDDVEAAADAKPAATASAAASPVHERRATFDVADPSSGDLPSRLTNGGDVTGVDRASVDESGDEAATTNVPLKPRTISKLITACPARLETYRGRFRSRRPIR
ncbi:MAG: hypothetical protein R3C99_23230 [Pirellulaceae bacterium]